MRITNRPEGWHKEYHPSMERALNFSDRWAWSGDANLKVHRTAKREEIPDFLADPELTASLVELAERVALPGIIAVPQTETERLVAAWDKGFEKASKASSVPISADLLKVVWAGCLSAAKAISPINYWMGEIGPWRRHLLWKCAVFPQCQENPVFRLGALAAPAFKIARKERITLDGVPLRTCGDPAFQAWVHITAFERSYS